MASLEIQRDTQVESPSIPEINQCNTGTCQCQDPIQRWANASNGEIVTWTEGSFESQLYSMVHEIKSFQNKTNELFQITEVGSDGKAHLLKAYGFLISTRHAFERALKSILDKRQAEPGKSFSLLDSTESLYLQTPKCVGFDAQSHAEDYEKQLQEYSDFWGRHSVPATP
jgi:hypothetical protein